MPVFRVMAAVLELESRRDSALRYMYLPKALVRCQAPGRQVGEVGCDGQSRMSSTKSCFPSPRGLETPSKSEVV